MTGQEPVWTFSESDETQLATLAAIARVEQQQREPIPTRVYGDAEDRDSDAETDNIDVLARSGYSKLKKRFLDRIAEVFARRKVPVNFVSCIALFEDKRVDRVTIYLSRNVGFEDVDTRFMGALSSILEGLCRERDDHTLTVQLWDLLLEYYQARISYHAREFIQHFQGKNHDIVISASEDDNVLKGLGQLRNGCKELVKSHIGLRGPIVERAYTIVREPDVETALGKILGPSQVRATIQHLGFLGRLRAAYYTFLQTARHFPSFSSVKITPIPPSNIHSAVRIDPEAALADTQALFGASGDALPQWIIRHVPEDRFKKMLCNLKQRLHVHAEMQMVFFLLHSNRRDEGFYPYIGVSKKTCLLCGHILDQLKDFESRKSHGKIYPQWTIPKHASLDIHSIYRMRLAIENLKETLVSMILDRNVLKLDHAKEFIGTPSISCGLSSVSMAPNGAMLSSYKESNYRRLETQWLESKARHTPYVPPPGILSEALPEEHDFSTDRAHSSKVLRCCELCNENLFIRRCSACKNAWYCSRDCQRSSWKRHKFRCLLKRPLDAADYLVLDCWDDEIPSEPLVLEDFGFAHFDNTHEQTFLLGLFQGLVKYMGVGSRKLHRWQRDNTLRNNIIAQFSKLPEGSRSGYYLWFLEHDWIFDRAPECISPRDRAERWLSARKSLLDPEDRDVPVENLRPESKRHAFVFYSVVFKGYHPHPVQPTWVSLGFCTCRSRREENELAEVYGQLIKDCTFQEFWEAMDTSAMLSLLDKYNLTAQRQSFRHFETHMKEVGRRVASVWYLKKYCNIDEPDPIGAVVVDYGFMNCHNPKDRLELKAIYQTFFERGRDEMELHAACLENKIFEYIKKVQRLDERFQWLMQNPYPTYCSHDAYVSENIIICPESLRDHVEKTKPEGTTIVTIPDSAKAAMQRVVIERSLAMHQGSGSAQTGCGVEVPINFLDDLSVARDAQERDEAE